MKHVEDISVTNILLMNKENCALKLVDEIILYYDARSKKHKKNYIEPNVTKLRDSSIVLIIADNGFLLLTRNKSIRSSTQNIIFNAFYMLSFNIR